MRRVVEIDYKAQLEDSALLSLARKEIVPITSGKRVIITVGGTDWLDDYGWSSWQPAAAMKLQIRYKISTFLIILTLLCVWMGKLSIDARRQRVATEWLLKNGGSFRYDWMEVDDYNGTPPYPEWLRNIFGEDCFQTVVLAELFDQGIEDLSETPIVNLPYLTELNLSGNRLRDISDLRQFSHLVRLDLSANEVADLTPLQSLRKLREVNLYGNKISDITPLFSLNLNVVALLGNPVDENQLEQLNHAIEERNKQ